jgi:hypothetical protein
MILALTDAVKRQFGGASREMKPWKVEEIKSEMKREGVKSIKLYHGPLKLLTAADVRDPKHQTELT